MFVLKIKPILDILYAYKYSFKHEYFNMTDVYKEYGQPDNNGYVTTIGYPVNETELDTEVLKNMNIDK